jgi:hypothetical protein
VLGIGGGDGDGDGFEELRVGPGVLFGGERDGREEELLVGVGEAGDLNVHRVHLV